MKHINYITNWSVTCGSHVVLVYTMDKLFNNSDAINTLVNQLLQLPSPSSSTLLEPTDTPSSDETSGLTSSTVALIVVVVFLSVLLILVLVTAGILLLFRKRR